MIINTEHKFVYIGMTKTASKSLHQFFNKLKYSKEGEMYKRPHKGYFYRHHGRIPPSKFNAYSKIISIRNPYTRVISIYNMIKENDMKNTPYNCSLNVLLDFLLKVVELDAGYDHPNYSYRWLPIWKYIEPIRNTKYFLKFETLEKDVRELPFINNQCIPHIGFNPNPSYFEKLATPEIIEKINIWAEKDFELFNYEKLNPEDYDTK